MSHPVVKTAKLETHKQRLSDVRSWIKIQRQAIYAAGHKIQ